MRAGLADRIYLPLQTYPSRELGEILRQVAEATGAPLSRLLEEYGEFIAPDLLRMHATLLDPSYRLLDIVGRSHEILTRMVLQKKAAVPLSTSLRGRRVSAHEALLTYSSPQRLCAIVKGVVRGAATHLGEPAVLITEPKCMLSGHEHCEIHVKTSSLSVRRAPRSSRGLDAPPSSRSGGLLRDAALSQSFG